MVDRLIKIDKGILLISLLLMAFGIVFVYSSSFALAQQRFGGTDFFLTRHLLRASVALIGLVFFANLDYHQVSRWGSAVYIVAVLLLLYVLTIPESEAVNGAKRWIRIATVRFQVSEFARIALMLTLASHLDKMGDRISQRAVFMQCIIKIGIVCSLIMLEPDFSTAIIIAGIGFIVLYVSGARLLHCAAVIGVIIPAALLAVFSAPYRRERILGFLNLAEHKSTIGYQVYQALIGLGHGGIWGVGVGQGEQKYFYLPEPHTDFVFSILGEEIGFAGLCIILLLFLVLIYRGIRVALKAPDRLGQIMAFGITMILATYALFHSAVNTGIVPTTGVPLPFLSYGGMSLIFTMCSIGIVLNISSQIRINELPVKREHKRQRRK